MTEEQPIQTAAACCTPGEKSARDPRISAHFDKLTAERTAGGMLPPMQPTTQRLFSLLSDVGDLHPSVLELGCGSGALLVGLLDAGAATAEGVDLSEGSLNAARRRAEASSVSDRVAFTHGDGARLALQPHDWVILDRVICCYPDAPSLLANALPAARQRVAFSVPESRGVRGVANRLIWAVDAWWAALRSNACPGYVHPLGMIEERLRAAGFLQLRQRTGLMWHVAVWERSSA